MGLRLTSLVWLSAACLGVCLSAQGVHAQRRRPPPVAPAPAPEPEPTPPVQEPLPEPEISESDARARLLFQAGEVRMQEGDYEGAVDDFQHSFELSGRTQLLYNLYVAHERLGHLDQSIEMLSRYLSEDPAPHDREMLTTRLETLRERARREQAAREEAARQPPPPPPNTTNVPAIVALAVGGAGLLTFGGAATASLVQYEDLKKQCATRACTDADVDGVRVTNVIADVGLGVGAAGAIVGVVLLVTGVGVDAPARAQVVPLIGPGLAGVGVVGVF